SNPRGPYNQDGTNTKRPTDDKPFMHSRDGKYYLSWGCFYAISDNVYGPFEYVGSVMDSTSFIDGLESPTWPNGFLQGRHGSFFEWHNQSYFAYCDISQTGNRYFRDTFISYIHYKENGEIAPIRVDLIGVGNYEAGKGRIEAEDYFEASGVVKKENENGGFSIRDIDDGDYLIFPNINGLQKYSEITMYLRANAKGKIELREGDREGKLLGTVKVKKGKVKAKATFQTTTDNLCLLFKGSKDDYMELDSFQFDK
ncbi:MAG: carbohydrate-binding protein, partial [Cyclobacteriaceae bacterium]